MNETPSRCARPLVEIRGLPGTLFSVQVVRDASTTVSVERGRVEVVQLNAPTDGALVLNAGQSQRFEPLMGRPGFDARTRVPGLLRRPFSSGTQALSGLR